MHVDAPAPGLGGTFSQGSAGNGTRQGKPVQEDSCRGGLAHLQGLRPESSDDEWGSDACGAAGILEATPGSALFPACWRPAAAKEDLPHGAAVIARMKKLSRLEKCLLLRVQLVLPAATQPRNSPSLPGHSWLEPEAPAAKPTTARLTRMADLNRNPAASCLLYQ